MLSLASFIIMRRHVAANEVYEFIKEAYPTIGKGTVYRNLDILKNKECAVVNKFGNTDYFSALKPQ